ncbi:hypothetical protein [Burkholderia sp. 572]|uniref:hypothetical protein n=1 Tax=Burkholderia sp. 572 TaxID=3156414 RepID=UPI0033982800
MSLTFEQEVTAVLAAQQLTISAALALAAKQFPNPVDEIDSRQPAFLKAGEVTFADPEMRARFRREIEAICMRATLHITEDRQSEG